MLRRIVGVRPGIFAFAHGGNLGFASLMPDNPPADNNLRDALFEKLLLAGLIERVTVTDASPDKRGAIRVRFTKKGRYALTGQNCFNEIYRQLNTRQQHGLFELLDGLVADALRQDPKLFDRVLADWAK